MTDTPIINGNKQYILIEGESQENPVLLYLHGGPGTPDLFFVKDTLKPLEKLFTICYWEQRGAGRSYAALEDKNSISLEQMIMDAEAVSRYLLQKFGQEKIYVLGQSWGTFLGSLVVQRYPELYHAYLSVGQVTNQYLSELESYNFINEQATLRKDSGVLRKLKKWTVPSKDAGAKAWFRYLNFQRWQVARYRGSMRQKNIFLLAIWKLLTCKEYTFADKLNYMKGSTLSVNRLWDAIINTNINEVVTEYQIPVYFFHGEHDHHTYYEGAKDYFEKLSALKKRFYTFPDAAHFPHVECFEEFERIVREEVWRRDKS
ncbi:alpha/beta hydrolase [Mucilaginibacter sp. ZT4R22]|uniref:Alpha/beta hydrolase n=1 Tax=Mucilaginibacter pankratovii TaxID=2772110 RepID=A0ABR7WZ91_9SPHI|nr:alpha/beta hydrolase [Mucilaginibacter pankratovii]MBD1366967.1 alpha/beta hydrolase [Mucilaginibacter pankratovii]